MMGYLEGQKQLSVKIQLKDPNHYPSCRQYPLKQEAKEGLKAII
jgi:hypothetical protein